MLIHLRDYHRDYIIESFLAMLIHLCGIRLYLVASFVPVNWPVMKFFSTIIRGRVHSINTFTEPKSTFER